MPKNTNETLQTIHSLCSTRKFASKDISEADISSIIEAAIRAPNSSGRQNYSIIVVKDRALLDQYYYGSKVALLFCVDFNRMLDYAKFLKKPSPHVGLVKFITGTTDTILVAQTANIAAKSLGIASLFTNSVHRQDLDVIFETFNLPKEFCFPLIGLCLGYSEAPHSKGDGSRKGRMREGVIHYDKYHHLTEDQLSQHILAYDDDSQHLATRKSAQVKNSGYEHFLEWFFSKWWTPEPNHDKINEFSMKLKETGFFS